MSRLERALELKLSSALSRRILGTEGVVVGYDPVAHTVDVEYYNPHGVHYGFKDKCLSFGLSLPEVSGILGLSPEPYKTGVSLQFLGGNADYPVVTKVYSLEPDVRYEKVYVRTGVRRSISGIELIMVGEP